MAPPIFRPRRLIFTPYPHWLRMPDPIREDCECYQHPRIWTLDQFLSVWNNRKKPNA